MKSKGFTFPELLAVIVILAIIALIATPVVMNVVEKSKKNAAERAVENLEHTAELYYYEKGILSEVTFNCTYGVCYNDDEVLDIKGKGPDEGTIIISKDGIITLNSILVNGYACHKENDKYTCIKSNANNGSGTIITVNGTNKIDIDNKTKVLADYKIYGNSVQDSMNTYNLPSEYQQVEYIESTGTQYLDTGFIPNQDTKVIVDYQYTAITDAFLFGSRTSSTSNAYAVNVGSSATKAFTSYGKTGNVTYANPDTKRHVIIKDKNLFYVDGVLKLTQAAQNFTAPGSLEIFAAYNGSTKGYLPSKARIFSFKIYDNGTLVRDFVPCYRKNDGVAGMYDLVNNTFYSSVGTKDFVVDKTIPSQDKPVEVKSVGEYDETIGKYKIPVKVSNAKNEITTNIYLDEPLRKVGEYADYIDFENKKLVRKVGVKTFDGTEEWTKHTTTKDGYGVFRNENLLTPLINAPISASFMSHFSLTHKAATADFILNEYRFTYSDNNINGSRFYVSALQTTVEEFKEWLSNNKPSIYYPLATPIEETIDLPEISTFKGKSTLEIITEISPSNTEISYYK